MRPLRSLFVCPCWRCREAREEERNQPTPDEVRAFFARMVDSGRYAQTTYGASAQKWREAIEKHTTAYPDANS